MAFNALFQVIAAILQTSTIEPLDIEAAKQAIPTNSKGLIS